MVYIKVKVSQTPHMPCTSVHACTCVPAGLLELSEKLKGDVGEAQRQADKYKSAAQHLREQVRGEGAHAMGICTAPCS